MEAPSYCMMAPKKPQKAESYIVAVVKSFDLADSSRALTEISHDKPSTPCLRRWLAWLSFTHSHDRLAQV